MIAHELRPFYEARAKERQVRKVDSVVEKISQQNSATQSRDEAGEKGRFIIMETVSNKKPTRGRPKSPSRHYSDVLKEFGFGNQEATTERSQLNWSLFIKFIGMLKDADEATQLRIVGCSTSDIKSGKRTWPFGLRTASVEIVRWVGDGDGSDERKKLAVELVDQLLTEKQSWREISIYFKERRTGKVVGTETSLTRCLIRALNDYLVRYPATTEETVRDALKSFVVLNNEKNTDLDKNLDWC